MESKSSNFLIEFFFLFFFFFFSVLSSFVPSSLLSCEKIFDSTMTKEMGVRSDPAIDRWAHMRENTHLYYKMNRKNALLGFLMIAVIPASIMYYTTKNHVRRLRALIFGSIGKWIFFFLFFFFFLFSFVLFVSD